MRHGQLAVAILLVAGLVAPTGTASAEESATPSPAAATETAPANQAPVAVDDRRVTVVAGRTAALKVLANDTDDGLGRPVGQVQHLEIATFDSIGGRVVMDTTRTTLMFTARVADARQSFVVAYTSTDGSLPSNRAKASVTVTAVPAPPVTRRVSLRTASTLVALRAYPIHGSVSPAGAAVPSTWRVQRLVNGRWTAYRKDRVDARGPLRRRFSTNRPVRYTFRAVATWSDGTQSGRARGSPAPSSPDRRSTSPAR